MFIKKILSPSGADRWSSTCTAATGYRRGMRAGSPGEIEERFDIARIKFYGLTGCAIREIAQTRMRRYGYRKITASC